MKYISQQHSPINYPTPQNLFLFILVRPKSFAVCVFNIIQTDFIAASLSVSPRCAIVYIRSVFLFLSECGCDVN